MHYLTKKDLEKRLYGIERYHPGDPSTKDLHLAASSGTTTGPPSLHVVYRPTQERDEAYREWIAPLKSLVRLLRNNHMSVQHTMRTLTTNTLNRCLVLDDIDMSPGNLVTIMKEFEPESLLGPPTRTLRWVQTLLNAGDSETPAHITLVQLSGEMPTPTYRALLSEALPNATLRNLYMFAGANFPLAPCPHSQGDVYHLLQGDSVTKIKIVDPDEEGVGEMIATTPTLTNFRTGDLGKLDTHPCPCGRSPVLKLFGRKDFDRVTVLGATFLRSELERILEPVMSDLADYQLQVGEKVENKTLRGSLAFIYVLRPTSTLTSGEIEKMLCTQLFVTKTRTLSDIIQSGLFLPLIVRKVAAIKHGKKELHLKKVNDPNAEMEDYSR